MKIRRISQTKAFIAGALSGVLFAYPLLAAPERGGPESREASFPKELREKIKYVIVIFPENRSFDSLYGKFPGADGVADSSVATQTQLMPTGTPYQTLPQPTTSGIPGISSGPDVRFNGTALANSAYDLQPIVPNDAREGDMVHRFYIEQYQINSKADRFKNDPKNAGGVPMSKFVAWSDNPGLTMSHYDASNLGEGRLAKEYVLCDNAFHSAFGGSFLNHMWLVAARTPVWPANPTEGSAPSATNATQFDSNGYPVLISSGLSDGGVTNDTKLPGFANSNSAQTLGVGDYWCVNTARPLRGPAGGLNTIDPNPPAPAVTAQPATPTSNTAISARLPLQTYDTIGDRLNDAGVSWVWYSQGWNDAKAGVANYLFQFHHQPFAYFAKYALATTPVPASGTTAAVRGTDSPGSKAHLKDADADFFTELENGSLPKVSFIKPIGQKNEHPGYASVNEGVDWIHDTVTKIQHSKIWKECAIFIMYDEHGGQWDHVTPPVVDEWGPGTRVPLTIISPFAKRGFVDHTQYETASLLAFIEKLHKLSPLNSRDANALAPVSAFEGQPDLVIRSIEGHPLAYQLPAYNEPKEYEVLGNLDGLKVDECTGALSGVPERKGSFFARVRVKGSKGHVAYTVRIDVGDKAG
jgi:acid phosphatase